MTMTLLTALLLGLPWSGAAGPRAEVRVTAFDVDGGADSSLASALAQALVDAGLAAAPERPSPGAGVCRAECVRVSVRKTEDHHFAIELRTHGGLAWQPVRLDPTASSFDQVHALAIEVELAFGRLRPPARHPARVRTASSSPAPSEPAVADAAPGEPGRAPAARSAESGLAAGGPPLPRPPVGSDQSDSAAPDSAARGAPVARAQAQPKAAPADEHLALDVAAMALAGTSSGLFMHGPTLGIQLRLSHRLDARASISFLRPENIDQHGSRYHLELLPLAATVVVQLPGVPGLHAGAGVEGLLVTSERNGDGPSTWSIGPLARIEYRHPIRSFALISAIHAAMHPSSWSVPASAGPRVVIPLVTVGASLGLEFNVL